tara:strand:+ start:38 stop:550 length:513 start_codon:yes stop_codon:yes gene_type:complete
MKLFVCSLFFLASAVAQEKKDTYPELISLLNQKLEKVREMQERSEELIREKSYITDRQRIVEIIAELNDLQAKIKKQNVDIRKLDYDLRFRFPEKGDDTERTYRKYNTSSEEIAEKKESFPEKLKRILEQAKKIYGPTQKELELARQKVERRKKELEKPKSRFQQIEINE